MRGKVDLKWLRGHKGGITPAYAGKSQIFGYQEAWAEDHPRVCGEKQRPSKWFHRRLGSPPRMRGKV